MYLKSILISDFDYTLCEHGNPEVFPENLEAVKKWRQADNYFAVATGRGEESLISVWPDCYQHCDFLIFCDGGIIKDRHGKIVYADRFGKELAEKLASALYSINYAGDHAFICFDDKKESPTIDAGICKIRLWFNDENDCAAAEQVLATNFHEEITAIPYYNVTFNDDARLPWVGSSMKHIIEVTHAGTDKSTGIKKLLNAIGVHNRSRIITIGDDKNDIPMIEAFNGYVIESGNPEVVKTVPDTHRVPHLYSLMNH